MVHDVKKDIRKQLYPHHNGTNQIADNTATLIDHIFINNKIIQKSPDIESGVIYCGLTDHLPIFINLTINRPLKSHKRPIARIYGDKHINKFCEKLEKTNWDELYEENNVNKALEIFYKNYNHTYQTSFPLKQLSRKRAKEKKWNIIGHNWSICIKNKLYRKSLREPSNINCRGHRMVWCNIWTSRCPSCGVPGHQQFLVKRPMTGFCWWLGCLWEISGCFNITFNDKS